MTQPGRGMAGLTSALRAQIQQLMAIDHRVSNLESGGVGSKGEQGDTGNSVQLRVSGSTLQARTVDPTGKVVQNWSALYDLANLTGATGPAAAPAEIAAAVADYLTAHPATISSSQVTEALTAYIAEHPLPAGPQGPPPSAEDLAAASADAVADYLTAHPAPAGPTGPPGAQGPGPSDPQVAGVLSEYMAAHPPAAGPAGPQGPKGDTGASPTTGQIFSQVSAYLGENPPAPGPQGPAGVQGPGPSDAQVSSAVSVYLGAHPPAAGPAGPVGPKGDRGEAGSAGSTGSAGPAGPAGPASSSVTAGSGAPTASGLVPGDVWINSLTGDVSRWSGNAWSVVGNIRGPAGPAGSAGSSGQKGQDGTKISGGTGSPGTPGNLTGDLYVDVSTGDVYAWS